MLFFKSSNQSTSGGSLVGTSMIVKNGLMKKWDGQIGDPKNAIYRFQCQSKIVKLTPGHIGVDVHYSIYANALQKNITFDRLLNLLPEGRDPQGGIITPDPEGPGWTNVDHNIYTAAYFIDPTVTSRD